MTIGACAGHMQADEVWNALSSADKQRVRMAAEPRGMMSDQEFRAMMREALAIGGSGA